MNIVFIGLDIFGRLGGMARYSQLLVTSLIELCATRALRGCTVISLWDLPGDAPEAASRIQFVPCSSSKLRAVVAFVRHLVNDRPEAVVYGHVLLSPLALVGRLLLPRARHLLIVYGIEVWGRDHRPISWAERLIVRHTFDRIVAISRYTQSCMQLAYGISPERFAQLAPAVDTDRRPAAAAAPPPGVARMLTVARLTPEARHKGVDRVIRSLAQVLAVFPNVVYDVVGEGGLRQELQGLSTNIGMEQHVRFLGSLDQEALDQEYQRSTLFIMPSSGEGFGIVFLEAWLHRLPVISGDCDASAELVVNGLNGLTVNPDSGQAIAQAIIRLLSDPQAARGMGEQGYRTVIENYYPGRFRRDLLTLLQAG